MSGRVFVSCGVTAIGLVIASSVFADRLSFLGRWPAVVVGLAIGLLMIVWLVIVMVIDMVRDSNAAR